MWGCSVTGTVSRDYGAVRRSINSLNFGQHYSMISARSFDIDNWAFKLASKLAWNWRTNRITLVPCQFLTSSMTAPGYYQVTTMAPGWILKLHTQKIGLNYAIVLAKINRGFTLNYCATQRDIFLPYFGILMDNKIGEEGKHPRTLNRQPKRHGKIETLS